MYEKINFTQELKKIPQKNLMRFLSTQLKSNELLQKEFIKKFNLGVQKKFIQDYKKEFEIQLKKCRKSQGKGNYLYDVTKFNSQFLSKKISYLTVLEKQEEYLEALKLCLIIYVTISYIVAINGKIEDLSKKTTAERYENKWKKMQIKLIELYQKIDEEEYFLFDRKTFFQELTSLYDISLHSQVFNFIFVREHAKLHWIKQVLKDQDKSYLENFNY